MKVIDFGISQMYYNKPTTRRMGGTPGYMAPEVVNKVPYDKTCDWYALGVIIHKLLT